MSYSLFKEKSYEIKQLNSISALLSWDMEVKMPHHSDRGFRADQSSLISGMIHERSTSDDFLALIDSLLEKESTSTEERDQLSKAKKDILKSKKLSKGFVEKFSKITSEAYTIWEKAKSESDFKQFEPALAKIVDLLKEKCELLGYEAHPYDALLDLYEESSTVAKLDPLFSDVESRLGTLIKMVLGKQNSRTNSLTQNFNIDQQKQLNKEILDLLGIDHKKYRLDESSHPFCSTFHPTDVRMTTRYNPNDLMSSIWSSIHESGHGRYEMGLDMQNLGLPSSEATSLGIHESQSRFWENNIGRSREFIELIFPIISKYFPDQMKSANPDLIFHEVNFVEPSLIRTEADELTYHYHIMIRYEIEKKLISGELNVSDAAAFWNESYSKYLNINVPSDAKGILQDVHWSFGGLGYFPTYSLGSFYASQWYQAIDKNYGIQSLIQKRAFEEINRWHSNHIHQFGSLYSSDELCIKSTGESLNFTHFENYIKSKFNL